MLCNWYGLPIAAWSLVEFQEASEAPVSIAILAERATPKFDQRTAARRVGKPYRLHNTNTTCGVIDDTKKLLRLFANSGALHAAHYQYHDVSTA